MAQFTTRPSTQPDVEQRPSLNELIESIRKIPLLQAEDRKTHDGKELTAGQRASLDKSSKLLKDAAEGRAKGDYENAYKAAVEAVKIRKDLYQSTHYLTVDALAAEKSLKRFISSPLPEVNELAEADRQQAKADQNFKNAEYASAAAAANKALAIRERILGRGHHELADCYRVIGAAQTELADLDAADKSLEKALDSGEKAYGKGHPAVAKILDRQGWLYINKNDIPKALACLQTAVRSFGLTTGDTLDAAEALDNLGMVLFLRGDQTDGLSKKVRALVIREKLAGPESEEAAMSYSNLAWIYTRLGSPEEVIPLRRRAVAIFDRLHGYDHPYTNTETVNLGVALQGQGKMDEAIALYKRAVEGDAKRKEPVDAKVVNRNSRLGVAYFEAGRREEADKTLKTSIVKAREVRTLGNTKAAAAELEQVSRVYEAYRMLDEAAKVIEEAFGWDKEAGTGPDDASIGRAVQYGNLLVQVGRLKQARELIEATTRDAVKLYGRGDRRTAAALMTLSVVCERTGDLEAAERNCDEVLRISESKYGPEHRWTALALRQMGRIYVLEKKMDLAKFTLDDAKKITETYQEYDPIEMIRLLQDYSDLQVANGERTEAVKTLRDAMARCRKLMENSKTMHMEGLTAKTLKKLLDAAASDSGAAADRETLRSELKAILTRLQAARALDAENKQWLVDLGESASQG